MIPVNIEVLAFDGELLGLNVRMFDTTKIKQSSTFLIILNEFRYENFQEIVKKKKKQYKNDCYMKKFGILGFLKNFGFDYLRQQKLLTKVNKWENGASLVRNKISTNYQSIFNGLEYFISLKEIRDIFNP